MFDPVTQEPVQKLQGILIKLWEVGLRSWSASSQLFTDHGSCGTLACSVVIIAVSFLIHFPGRP